jgi:TonB family protein
MRVRGFAITILAACAASAAAQDIPPRSDAPSHEMTEICTERAMRRARFYPERAQERMLNGSATLDCVLNDDNTLRTCQVVEEAPENIGFGASALNLACRWQPSATANNPLVYTDESGMRRIRRPVRFRLPGGRDPAPSSDSTTN